VEIKGQKEAMSDSTIYWYFFHPSGAKRGKTMKSIASICHEIIS
jgi:hypothetical protein